MKALTIWQPWASLLACGAKKYETRGRAISYRGPIAIHAALTPFKRIIKMMFPLHEWRYAPDYTAKRKFVDLVSKFIDVESLCYGAIIATAELVGCHKIHHSPNFHRESGFDVYIHSLGDSEKYEYVFANELLFGDWTAGRYALEFANMTMLPEPIPVKGRQGLWNWEETQV